MIRKALAGPFILGISSGASLGVALVVLATGAIGTTVLAGVGFAGDFALAAAAATGAGLTLAVVLLVASIVESRMTLLIVGLMLGYLTSAIVSLLLFFAVAERIQAYINWTFGSFGTVTWDQLRILAPAVTIGLVVSFAQMKTLNALLLGEHYAASMGLNLAGARFAVIAATALMAGAVTAFCGPIGFVGVAVPHLCRGLFTTSDHRLLLPGTAIIGAIVALVAALIAEVPGSSLVLPLNAVTALMGAPVVIWVIVRKRVIKAAI